MQPDLAAAALAGLALRRVLAAAVLRQGRIVWASPGLLAMFGLEAGEARFLDLVAPADREALAEALQEKPGTEVGPRSFTGLRADGGQFDAELSGCTLELPGGTGVAIALSDVTVQRRAQAQLSYLALRDPLTELPNRALFFDRLRQALVAARRHGSSFAVLVSDLDGFKLINDRYGHETGDALLQMAAKRLRAATREGDTVARIGGDEFSALLARAATPEDAAIVARRMVQALDQPIVVAGQPCQVGISIGIALYPAGGKDMDVLVAHADAAMYAAKRAGGRCYKFAGERDADISGPLRLPFFEWSEAHSVGVPLMDEQHKELAELINRIGEDLKAGHEAERLHQSFDRLVQAARAHFADEEQLMAHAGLGAAAERHKQEHRRLLEELESQADALEGRSMSLTMRYLNFWLLHHIESADTHQAERLIEAGLGGGDADEPVLHGEPQGHEGAPPDVSATRDLERWHQAVRRGLWVAPEPRPAARGAQRPGPGDLH
jgi:diguanylate cyclase (GGDEF)-like protein/hemerythrin-like metal-binding protein